MKSSLAQFLILILVCTVTPRASGAESIDSINFGIGGIIRTMPHCNAKVYFVEYEHLYTPTLALLGRGSEVHYRFDDGLYEESGRPWGLDVGARYYPAGEMRGFFMGGTLGYWRTADWTFIQNQNRPNQWQGRASSNSLRLNIDVGDRIPILSTNVSIMPEVNLGKFFSSSSCQYTAPASLTGTPCSQKSEVNYYLFVGLTVGVVF